MAGNQERQFRFGAIVHEDYQELAMLLPELEDRLNQNINLKDYTDRVEWIYFVPILMPDGENGEEEEEENWFDEGKRTIMLKVKISQVIPNQVNLGKAISLAFNKHLTKLVPNPLLTGINNTLNFHE